MTKIESLKNGWLVMVLQNIAGLTFGKPQSSRRVAFEDQLDKFESDEGNVEGGTMLTHLLLRPSILIMSWGLTRMSPPTHPLIVGSE